MNWGHPGGAGLGIRTLLGWLKPRARFVSEVQVKAGENFIIHVGARARETEKVALAPMCMMVREGQS